MKKLSFGIGVFLTIAALAPAVLTATLLAQENEPANAPMAVPNVVPEGTTFLVRLQEKLDTADLHTGQHFKVKLDEDLISANGNIIPRGQKIKGHVSSVEQGLHTRLLLSFDEIETNHGWIALIATITGVPGEHAVKVPDSEGAIERNGSSVRQTIEDAAAGAAHGAGTGGASGAASGAAASLLANRDLRLEKGTTLEVRLDRALPIPSH